MMVEDGVTLFDRSFEQITKSAERAKSGKLNCIPLPFNRTRKFYAGIEKGTYVIVTANSGVGKSKLAKYLFVTEPYRFTKEVLDAGIKLKIFWFCLEESRENFMLSLISNHLYEHYNIRLSVKQLKSIGEPGYYLPDETLAKIAETKEYFVDLEKILNVYDDVRNPMGIFLTVKKYMESVGHWVKKTINIDGIDKEVNDYYVPDDPEEYVMVVTDHISLLHTEKDENGQYKPLHQLIGDHSKLGMRLRDAYGCIVGNIQQQSASKEQKQFTIKGFNIDEKLEPSLDGLGDNKLTQRDANVVIGLFAPDRYQIESYEGYDIRKYQDNFRMMMFLKMRDDTSNVRTPLFFDGAVNFFKEMPIASDENELKKVHEYIKSFR